MAIIQDIRMYRCTTENVDGIHPENLYNPDLGIISSRICMKLREKGFSMGDFHHLYVDFTTALKEGQIKPANKSVDKYFPWYRYYEIGVTKEMYDNLVTPDSVPAAVDLIEKLLVSQFSTPEFGSDIITKCVSEAVSQGPDMLMKYKEKITAKRRAILYLRLLDNSNYFPLLKVFDSDGNIILEKDLEETRDFDGFGEIQLNTKRIKINPRKNGWSDREPIMFEL